MQHRLEWAKKHRNWTVQDWRQVVFSDETKINVWGSDGCKYYWRRPGDPLQPHHLDFTVKHEAGKLMMWGCITSEGPGCTVATKTVRTKHIFFFLSLL
ncbi:hypothetical protein G6F43_012798 [Rhizopus delemar]|nr:hypothetical protein G6F43_012798 [Rhizopus delemar]